MITITGTAVTVRFRGHFRDLVGCQSAVIWFEPDNHGPDRGTLRGLPALDPGFGSVPGPGISPEPIEGPTVGSLLDLIGRLLPDDQAKNTIKHAAVFRDSRLLARRVLCL